MSGGYAVINGQPWRKTKAISIKRERPECDHEKQEVEIETFPGADYLPGTRLLRKGWYCPTCRRVYAQVTN